MSVTSASLWLSETEQDVEEQAVADGLSCSQHRWRECPVDFGPCEASSQLVLSG